MPGTGVVVDYNSGERTCRPVVCTACDNDDVDIEFNNDAFNMSFNFAETEAVCTIAEKLI